LAAAFALLLLVGFALLMLWARLAAVLVGLCVAVLGEWAVLTPGSCDMLTRTEKVWVLQLVVSFRPPRACAPPPARLDGADDIREFRFAFYELF
jgi:hypothetical protein